MITIDLWFHPGAPVHTTPEIMLLDQKEPRPTWAQTSVLAAGTPGVQRGGSLVRAQHSIGCLGLRSYFGGGVSVWGCLLHIWAET